MKIPGKGLAIVAAPVLVAAALLGVPLAGSAHALERQTNCYALRLQAADYYEEASLDFYDENQALEAGDWTGYVYYSYLEALHDQEGDDVTAQANNKGC
jgi:hypothetical protein